ncbi:MAG: hypothetical protein HUJ54_11980, partial [Erysipelotrichaceae bacterium]|nr:hypothetical protein [Erysipelotrichaceae bacterium]
GAMCQPAPGAEQYAIGANKSEMIDLNSISDDLALLEFSFGALTDGTFLLAGPSVKDGKTDTYILKQDFTLSEFDKRAWYANLLKPASAAYNNAFYVLAKIAPSGIGKPTFVFSSTAVNAGFPNGDALVKTIQSIPAKTGAGVPALRNTELSVTQKDLVNNLKDTAQKVIDRINQSDKDSEAYLEANRLAETDVSLKEKEAILSAAGQEKMKENLFWMDLTMNLKVPEQERIKLKENAAGTQVSIQIPDFPEIQKGCSRSYRIFASSPDGEGSQTEVIVPELNTENQTLSFSWKKSGVYAIGYLDTKNQAPAPDLDSKPSDTSAASVPAKTAVPASASSNSATAAVSNFVIWSLLAAAGAAGTAGFRLQLKKRK